MAALRREVFSVETFREFLLAGSPHALHLAGEMEGLACHRVVEVHRHTLFAYGGDGTLDYLTLAVEHRDGVSHYEEIFPELAVRTLERAFRQLYLVFFIVLSVTFVRAEGELKRVPRLFSLERFLELREEHSCAVDVLKRLFCRSPVCNLSFYFQFVAHCYNFVLFNCHISKVINFH